MNPGHTWDELRQRVDRIADTPIVTLQARSPWCGEIEEPVAYARVHHTWLSVSGWLAHEAKPVLNVVAYVDHRLPTRLGYGASRPDVARAFPFVVGADSSGFSGEVCVPVSAPRPWRLVVVAEFGHGEREIVMIRQILGPPFYAEMHGQLPPYDRATWHEALRTLIPVGRGHDWRRHWPLLRTAREIWRRHASPRFDRREVRYEAPTSASKRRISAVIVNDNFSLGGAAWFGLELARALRAAGHGVVLASPEVGPLQGVAEAAGIPTQILRTKLPHGVDALDGFHCEAARMGGEPIWNSADVVIANTMVSAWAVHVAQRCGKRAVLYVHESARLGSLVPLCLMPAFESALGAAQATVFVTEWTRRAQRSLEREHSFRLLRSWVDADALETKAAAHSRDDLRGTHGIPRDIPLIVCLGHVCDRKGQRTLIQSVEVLVKGTTAAPGLSSARSAPPFLVLLVGAVAGPDRELVTQEIGRRGVEQVVRFVDPTPEAWQFLRMADIYACPSYEEGFPRALMEAAIMELLIVATDCCGIPEMISEAEAWIVPPGEPLSFAEGLGAALQALAAGDHTRPRAARERVRREYGAKHVLPNHVALVVEAVEMATPVVSR